MLTVAQRMQVGDLLESIEQWRLGAAQSGPPRWIDTYVAPRLFRNGGLDFIVPDSGGQLARTLLATSPEYVFLIANPVSERWLAGFARASGVERPWECAELRSYLTWRSPRLIEALANTIDVVVFRPTYLLYGDRRRPDEGFAIYMRPAGQEEASPGEAASDDALSPEQRRILAEISW